MSDQLETESDTRVLEKLYKNKINYLSLTLFKSHKPIVSYCNHAEWLDFYKAQYGLERSPPVQKYICHSALRLLTWDFSEIDKEAKAFIQKRSNVVEASAYVTVLFRRKEYLTAITLGTKQKLPHLIHFLNNDLNLLLLMEQNLAYRVT